VLVLAAGLAGLFLVGGGSADRTAQAAVKRAASRTVDAGSWRFELRVTAPEQFRGLFTLKPMVGTMDSVHRRGFFRYGDSYQVLYDGDVTYMQWSLPWRPGSFWVRIPMDLPAPDPLDLEDRAMRNPVGLLQFLKGAGDDVREVGSEDVRGTHTTHYEGTLDLQNVVDQAPAAQQPELQDTLDFIGEDTPTKVPFGLWVDEAGVAHRLRIDQEGGTSMTIEYYDFGVPVVVTPPPADTIVSDEELERELSRHEGDSDCGDSETGSGGASSTGSSDSPDAGPLGAFVFLGGTGHNPSGASGGTDSGQPEVRICLGAVTESG
jgi:hypothetical protein